MKKLDKKKKEMAHKFNPLKPYNKDGSIMHRGKSHFRPNYNDPREGVHVSNAQAHSPPHKSDYYE